MDRQSGTPAGWRSKNQCGAELGDLSIGGGRCRCMHACMRAAGHEDVRQTRRARSSPCMPSTRVGIDHHASSSNPIAASPCAAVRKRTRARSHARRTSSKSAGRGPACLSVIPFRPYVSVLANEEACLVVTRTYYIYGGFAPWGRDLALRVVFASRRAAHGIVSRNTLQYVYLDRSNVF